MSETACPLPGFWRSALSGKDNQSIDIVRLLGCAGVFVYFLMSTPRSFRATRSSR